mmetsp:Transcript_27764/g.87803  ORF Transcript_27764/g.87803 Transcript_27764/m.87803 type:complete len:509 (+) Transcript_27764:1021-2547(+)
MSGKRREHDQGVLEALVSHGVPVELRVQHHPLHPSRPGLVHVVGHPVGERQVVRGPRDPPRQLPGAHVQRASVGGERHQGDAGQSKWSGDAEAHAETGHRQAPSATPRAHRCAQEAQQGHPRRRAAQRHVRWVKARLPPRRSQRRSPAPEGDVPAGPERVLRRRIRVPREVGGVVAAVAVDGMPQLKTRILQARLGAGGDSAVRGAAVAVRGGHKPLQVTLPTAVALDLEGMPVMLQHVRHVRGTLSEPQIGDVRIQAPNGVLHPSGDSGVIHADHPGLRRLPRCGGMAVGVQQLLHKGPVGDPRVRHVGVREAQVLPGVRHLLPGQAAMGVLVRRDLQAAHLDPERWPLGPARVGERALAKHPEARQQHHVRVMHEERVQHIVPENKPQVDELVQIPACRSPPVGVSIVPAVLHEHGLDLRLRDPWHRSRVVHGRDVRVPRIDGVHPLCRHRNPHLAQTLRLQVLDGVCDGDVVDARGRAGHRQHVKRPCNNRSSLTRHMPGADRLI